MKYRSSVRKARILARSLKKYIKKTDLHLDRILKYIHFYLMANKNGVVSYRLSRIAEEYTDDFFADTGIMPSEKEWYYQRGFCTFKTSWYGLTKENYNDYISDFDFYNSVNYLKNEQLINWFDNKLSTYYTLSLFRDYLPRHYFYIDKGELVPIDVDLERYGTVEDVRDILQSNPIALKSCTGGHGKGFYKIVFQNGGYYINNESVQEKEVIKLITSLNDYLLTEYGIPHKIFRDACGEDRFAVLRTVTVFDKADGPQITAILLRLGSSTSGLVTDYDGCINCGVDLETGRVFNPLLRSGDEQNIIIGKPQRYHPDTGADLEDITVPHFDELCKLAKTISTHLSMTPYLVTDIIPTDTGFEILEINSHGQVRNLEPFFPFRKNEYNLKVFKTKDW